MKIKIEVTLGNAAMQTWGDVQNAVTDALRGYDCTEEPRRELETKVKWRWIYDANGNTVGKVMVR